jgi:hypothetical protein
MEVSNRPFLNAHSRPAVFFIPAKAEREDIFLMSPLETGNNACTRGSERKSSLERSLHQNPT